MVVIDRKRGRPGQRPCVVTGIAHIAAVDMADGFCMTIRTESQYLTVIDRSRGHWRPGCWTRFMAGITDIGATQVTAVLAVAGGTDTDDLVMVHRTGRHRQPTDPLGGQMAGLTHASRI